MVRRRVLRESEREDSDSSGLSDSTSTTDTDCSCSSCAGQTTEDSMSVTSDSSSETDCTSYDDLSASAVESGSEDNSVESHKAQERTRQQRRGRHRKRHTRDGNIPQWQGRPIGHPPFGVLQPNLPQQQWEHIPYHPYLPPPPPPSAFLPPIARQNSDAQLMELAPPSTSPQQQQTLSYSPSGVMKDRLKDRDAEKADVSVENPMSETKDLMNFSSGLRYLQGMSSKVTSSLSSLTAQDILSTPFSTLGRLLKTDMSSCSVTLFDRDIARSAVEKLRMHYGGAVFHIVSFNILANEYTRNPRHPGLYSHCAKKALEWKNRVPAICKVLSTSAADIICLQEVSRPAYELTFKPLFASLGYRGRLQCSTIRLGAQKSNLKNAARAKKKLKELPGLATFYKASMFEEAYYVSSFRALVLGLQLKYSVNRGKVLGIINCHLEGHPMKHEERKNQFAAALKKVAKFSPDYLVVSGDLNSNITTEDSSRNNLGLCNVINGSLLVDAYSSAAASTSASEEEDHRDATCLLSSKKEESLSRNKQKLKMIDHVLFKKGSLQVIGLQRIFNSTWNRKKILRKGLPSTSWPSDHLNIGVVFKLKDLVSYEEMPKEDEKKTEVSLATKIEKTKHLLQQSLDEEEWNTWKAIENEEEALREMLKKSGRKMDKTEIEEAKSRSKRKQSFIMKLTGSKKKRFEDYIKLRKEQHKKRKTKK